VLSGLQHESIFSSSMMKPASNMDEWLGRLMKTEESPVPIRAYDVN
jgi:hypothetical protein